MGRPGDCAFEVRDDGDACADTSPPISTNAIVEAAVAALEAIDTHRIAGCPQCESSALQRWGKGRSKVQRWRCRDCERSFSSTTGTALAGLHAPGKLRLVLIDMLSGEPSSCRALASRLTLSAMTIWGWRQRINRILERIVADRVADDNMEPIAVDTVILRESRKASREWVDHRRDPATHREPNRHRWVDYRERQLPLPDPMTPHLLAVQLTKDHRNDWHAALLPGLPGASPADVAKLAELLPSSHLTAEPPAERNAPIADRILAQDGEASLHGFRTFLRPFAGPAERYLSGYVAWFVAWRAGSSDAHRLALAERAWRELTKRKPTRFWTWAPRTA